MENSRLDEEWALTVDHLVKVYGNGKVAVDDISFKVKKGSLFAFLGVNGAGKSTTINIICSILEKTSGRIVLEGHDLERERTAVKNIIGVVFQNSVLDNMLSVYDNLRFRTAFYSLSNEEAKNRIEEITNLLELRPILKQKVGTLSGGQKRRVDIARAIVHAPKFLILDEPTTGLDPKTRQIVWELIDKVRKETGMTVFLTTHYLEESDLATYVVIMDKGHIITEGSPNELKNRFSRDYLIVYRKLDKEFEKRLREDHLEFDYDTDKKSYRIVIKDTNEAKALLGRYGDEMADIEIKKGTMDDVFLSVTGRKNHGIEEEND